MSEKRFDVFGTLEMRYGRKCICRVFFDREEADHLASIHRSRAEGTYRYFIEDCERESEVSAGYEQQVFGETERSEIKGNIRLSSGLSKEVGTGLRLVIPRKRKRGFGPTVWACRRKRVGEHA